MQIIVLNESSVKITLAQCSPMVTVQVLVESPSSFEVLWGLLGARH